MNNNAMRDVGSTSFNWSRSAGSWSNNDTWSANAYYLGLYSGESYPSRGPFARWLGLPVRCLVILVTRNDGVLALILYCKWC